MTERLLLIEAACAGEPSALERLLLECQPELRKYAQQNCIVSDVDDAVQETMLVLSRHVTSLREARAWAHWAFRILRRMCHRLGRITLRYDLWGDDALDAMLARGEPSVRLDLVAAIESLPESYREALVLRDFEGLTIREMAARLELSSAAVKSRLHRARALTREYLNQP